MGTGYQPGHQAAVDALIGGEQRDPGLLQLVLNLRAAEHVRAIRSTDSHTTATPLRPPGLGHQLGDATIARNRDVELLVRPTVAAHLQRSASRLHVVEVRHDGKGW